MILLSNFTPFTCGRKRKTFGHPLDSDKCIKISYRRHRGWIRGKAHYDQNAREVSGHLYFQSLRNPDVYRHIPRFYGTVQTDLGDGVVTQLMRDYDGGISETLCQRIRKNPGEMDYACRESVAEFKTFLLQSGLIIHDCSLENLLSVRISEKRERLYLIEGYGSKVLIPLEKYFPPMRNAKIRRLNTRLDAEIAKLTDGDS